MRRLQAREEERQGGDRCCLGWLGVDPGMCARGWDQAGTGHLTDGWDGYSDLLCLEMPTV